MPLIRRFVALLAATTLVAAGASCGGDDDASGGGNGGDAAGTLLERARADGITIGIANEPPYAFEEGGEATGEAPALAREIFSRLDITEVDYEAVEFGALIPGLAAGRYDVVAAGMFITPERAEQVAFANPDYCATAAFAVAEGNPKNLTDFESLAASDATLGVLAGAVEEGYAEAAGVPADRISPFPSTPDLFDGLTGGRVDAVALTAPSIRYQVQGLDGFESTEGFVPVVDGEEQLGCGAFAFRQDDADFRDEFNRVLREMQDNDEVLPVIEEFGFTEEEVSLAKDLTVEDLAGTGG